jgi:hypothetical protein
MIMTTTTTTLLLLLLLTSLVEYKISLGWKIPTLSDLL